MIQMQVTKNFHDTYLWYHVRVILLEIAFGHPQHNASACNMIHHSALPPSTKSFDESSQVEHDSIIIARLLLQTVVVLLSCVSIVLLTVVGRSMPQFRGSRYESCEQ